MTAPVDVYISAGSNIDPIENLRQACRGLEQQFGALTLSPVYRSKAVGFDGDDFLNCVIVLSTSRAAESVNDQLKAHEDAAGRDRGSGSFAPRTLDLDLILYGSATINAGRVHVPHDDILKYAFVLGPLAELAPDLVHPVEQRTMRSLWDAFDRRDQPLERLGEPLTW